MLYLSAKGKELKAAAIRVKPPGIRRRGIALSIFYKVIGDAFSDIEITQEHRTKGSNSASTLLAECAADDAGEFIPVVMVIWHGTGSEAVDVDGATPQATADALRKLA